MKALVTPLRPYGYVFAYSGRAHQAIQGHYQYSETDQYMVGGAVNHVQDIGIAGNMYIMLCGRMTPEQRQIVCRQVQPDTDEYMNILNYFMTGAC